MKPKLIAFEGVDGAGKSVQIEALLSLFREDGIKTEHFHFPRLDKGNNGYLVEQYLHGELGDVNPELASYLFAENQADAAKEINRALNSGKTVLLDRYIYSNMAFQCARVRSEAARAGLLEWIAYISRGLPEPDIALFLDVPMDFVKANLDERAVNGDADIYEEDLEYEMRVGEEYRRLCNEHPTLRRVECWDGKGEILPQEEILKRIKSEIYLSL